MATVQYRFDTTDVSSVVLCCVNPTCEWRGIATTEYGAFLEWYCHVRASHDSRYMDLTKITYTPSPPPTLSKHEAAMKVLEWMGDRRIAVRDVVAQFGVTNTGAQKYLYYLLGEGYVERIGVRQFTTYRKIRDE